ncbi:MAG: DNA gyrase/topoisomerase IV subunit A [Muribaculaceae bacterium]|nr:DNA gyrase/topoisomerase IV subunit A [Muribaculaceae bacterium]
MSDEYTPEEEPEESAEAGEGGFGSMLVDLTDDTVRHQLRGMFQSWYLDYASYTILDRAIPHADDGLKPVQRRLLHTMKKLDDERFIKVANIVGATMAYHPHGDASIYGALVQLGQKGLLVETQGNWGNILTGASAAAGRYIEARLSEFASEVLFNPKVTQWTPSYDGRSKEPVTLPAKYPLLLAQGVGGIAAGLSSLILPHNFNEIIDAAVAYLKGESFELYPDFATGGLIDVSRYNDGARGGRVRVRAKIEKVDNRTLAITELPYGVTSGSLIESILKANEKGKIKIRQVDDNTAATALVMVYLQAGVSSDKTIDALYAFTDCELAISPNCCVIYDDKPHFLGVSDVLRRNVDRTRNILKAELEIELDEARQALHFSTLERIFIEERIYKDKGFETADSKQAAIRHIGKRIEEFAEKLVRPVTDDDLLRLLEIKMARILRFNSKAADEAIVAINKKIDEINSKLSHITDYTIEWYTKLRQKYGDSFQRTTAIRSFETITAARVAEANQKLYVSRKSGFAGFALKGEEDLECIGNCSELDDVIIFYADGNYKVFRVAEKVFVGTDSPIQHIAVFKAGDERTTYNVIYQDGKGGTYYMKRFHVTGVTRDKMYNLTQGKPGSKIKYFSANPNGEAEIVKVTLKPKPKLKTLQFDIDFATLKPKNKGSMGNIVTRNEVHSIRLKEAGQSTLGGRKVWFDPDVLRLNYEGRGNFLGEFNGTDQVLVVLKSGEFYTTSFDSTNHYDENIERIELFRPEKVWTAVLFDASQGFYYLKRFNFESSPKRQSFIGDNPKSSLTVLSDEPGARFEVTFGGADSVRGSMLVDAVDFVGAKSFRAKGKRLTQYAVASVVETEPRVIEAPQAAPEDTPSEPEREPAADTPAEADRSDDEVRDELTGQQRIF